MTDFEAGINFLIEASETELKSCNDSGRIKTLNGEIFVYKAIAKLFAHIGTPLPKTSKRGKASVPNDLAEVLEHFKDMKYSNPETEGQKFWLYYQANGWMVGKNHMKEWKAAAAHWNMNAKERSARPSNGNNAVYQSPAARPQSTARKITDLSPDELKNFVGHEFRNGGQNG